MQSTAFSFWKCSPYCKLERMLETALSPQIWVSLPKKGHSSVSSYSILYNGASNIMEIMKWMIFFLLRSQFWPPLLWVLSPGHGKCHYKKCHLSSSFFYFSILFNHNHPWCKRTHTLRPVSLIISLTDNSMSGWTTTHYRL